MDYRSLAPLHRKQSRARGMDFAEHPRCICSPDSRFQLFLMRFTYQQYWPPRSDQTFTKLQGIICGRRLETFCRVSKTFLQASLNTPSTEVLSPNTSATPPPSLDTADNLSD